MTNKVHIAIVIGERSASAEASVYPLQAAVNRRLAEHTKQESRHFCGAGGVCVLGLPLSTTRVFTKRAGESPTFLYS